MQARQQRAIAELRSMELEKMAGFQQSMLEDIDIEAMGSGLATGLRGQIAEGDPASRASLEPLLAQVNTADLARGMIDRDLLANAEAAIDRDFAGQPALAANLRESVARVYAALGMSPQAAREFGEVADYRAGQAGEAAPTTLAARLAQADALLGAAEVDAAAAIIERARPLAQPLPLNDPPARDWRLRRRACCPRVASANAPRPCCNRCMSGWRSRRAIGIPHRWMP